MTLTILWVIAVIGTALTGASLFQKKQKYTLLAAGQMLVAPVATVNLLTESGILWKIIFATVLLSGLIAVFNLASDTKEK